MRLVFISFMLLFFAGCALRPYQIPIQQGKEITPEMINTLKPGMTQDQVAYILGAPNLKDPYHPDDWYYIYGDKENHQPMMEHRLKLTFIDGQLQSMSGDYPPPPAFSGKGS